MSHIQLINTTLMIHMLKPTCSFRYIYGWRLWKNTIERFIFRKLALKGCSVTAIYHCRELNVNCSSFMPHQPPPSPNDTRAPPVIPNLQQVWPANRGGGENENDAVPPPHSRARAATRCHHAAQPSGRPSINRLGAGHSPIMQSSCSGCTQAKHPDLPLAASNAPGAHYPKSIELERGVWQDTGS